MKNLRSELGEYRLLFGILFAFGLIYNLYCLLSIHDVYPVLFWDLDVYVGAVDRYYFGLDPYSIDSGLNFVYPPVFFSVFGFGGSYFLLLFITVIYLATIIIAFYHDNVRFFIQAMLVSACLFPIYAQPRLLECLLAGNITPYMHILMLTVLFSEKGWNKPFVTYISIAFLSMIKPYFLLYMLTPVLMTNIRSQLAFVLATVVVVAFVYLYQYLFMYSGFMGFVDSLLDQTKQSDPGVIYSGDIGFGFYRIFLIIFHAKLSSVVATNLTIILLSTGIYMIRDKLREVYGDLYLLLISIALAIVSNPRLKEYDEAFLSGAIVLVLMLVFNRSQATRKYLMLATVVMLNYCLMIIRKYFDYNVEWIRFLNDHISSIYLPMLVIACIAVIDLYLNKPLTNTMHKPK